ncbi:hypothetical protein GCM10011577_35810 [Pseudarthrobacter polychromogenes]|uniref:Uncharacterized protein n=1 Tax=Pseudarthrobacter polychromogenes TaxID=1676 RepID=A0ABQ1Y0H6_9MICC|nr:hypothetical protein GCM10011577_35810 [Pseudarthrobacter polychromogenes]
MGLPCSLITATWCVSAWVSMPAMTLVGSLAKMEIAPSVEFDTDRARARWADKTVMGLVVSGSYEVMSAWLDTPFNGP